MSLVDKIKSMSAIQSLVVGLAIGLLFYFLVFDTGSSQRGKIQSMDNELNSLKGELSDLEKAVIDADKLGQLVKEMGENISNLVKYIPEKLTGSEIVKDLSISARSVGAKITGVRVQSNSRIKGQGNSIYEPIPVEVELEGAFHEVMSFLSQLTKIERIYTLEDMSFSVGRQDSNKSKIRFVTTVVGYKYLPPKDKDLDKEAQ